MADSVHQFIVSLEAKAKRILKDADKKRRDEARYVMLCVMADIDL